MTTSLASKGDVGRESPERLYTALRILGILVLALMLLSILYSVWIALSNWSSITV